MEDFENSIYAGVVGSASSQDNNLDYRTLKKRIRDQQEEKSFEDDLMMDQTDDSQLLQLNSEINQ